MLGMCRASVSPFIINWKHGSVREIFVNARKRCFDIAWSGFASTREVSRRPSCATVSELHLPRPYAVLPRSTESSDKTDKLSMKAAEICLRREASVGGEREQHHKHIHNKCLHASPTMALNELINIEWNELGVGSRWENISSVKRSIVCDSELVICMFTRSFLAFNRRKLSVLHEISDASHQKRLRDSVEERQDTEAFN